MKKHILVVSQYFYPENFRINDICFEWVKRGYKVTVLTGIPNYPKGKFFTGYGWFRKRKEVINGVKVVRIPIIPRRNNSVFLAMNYFSFVISGWFWKLFTPIKPDLVFNFEVSPMTQALPGIWLAKRRKIPFYIYVQDLWPENLEIVGNVKNRFILKRVNKMVDYIYKNSKKILVTSKAFKTSIKTRGIDAEKIIFWPQYAEDFYKPINEDRNNQVFTVMFTGNIGDAQGLEILPRVASKIKDDGLNKKVRFVLVGDGRSKERLKSKVSELNVSEMFEFIDQQPSEKMPEYLAEADVAFLSFSENELFKMTIPAKLQTYLACGKPIYAVVSGESEKVIKESNTGFFSKPGDINAAYNNLIKFIHLPKDDLVTMSKNAILYSQTNYNKKTLMDDFDKIIEEVNHV